jgi:uncharacterized protein (DUF1800 family)
VASTDPLGVRDAWHLLRRAGFGGSAREAEQLAGRSRADAVDALLAVEPSAARGPAPRASINGRELHRLRAWWLRRMSRPHQRLREKMVLFWHDHFPSSGVLVRRPDAIAEQNATLRAHALGSYRELVHRVTRDRAMLEYLDGRRSQRGAVNENYARELMELFTLGPRDDDGFENYGQADVHQLARSLTGFMVNDVRKKPFVGVASNRFDAARKRIFSGRAAVLDGNLGVEGEDGAELPPQQNVLDAIFAHRDVQGRPTLARFLVRKLWAWFATPEADEAVVQELAQAFVDGGYEVSELLRAILVHDAFYAEAARSSTTKTPVDFAVQAVLALGVEVDWRRVLPFLAQMGMDLFEPPGVEGWPQGEAWLASSRYLARMGLAQAIASGRGGKDGFTFRPHVPEGATPASLVEGALAQLGLEVGAGTRARLVDYVSGGEFGTESWYEMKLRGLYALLLALPEFQIH